MKVKFILNIKDIDNKNKAIKGTRKETNTINRVGKEICGKGAGGTGGTGGANEGSS